jgi:hypothetical protein
LEEYYRAKQVEGLLDWEELVQGREALLWEKGLETASNR